MANKETSTAYDWGDSGVIRHIDVRQQDNGRAVAYIYADYSPENAQARQNIRSAIRLKGWGTLSDHRDGRFSLRVTGLKNGGELLDMLKREGFIKTEPMVTTRSINDAASKGAGDFIHKNSLRASAIIYTLGNAMYFMGGRAAGSPETQKMALSFAAGDGLLGIFGGRDDARQYKQLLGELKAHMQGKGIEIPGNASIHVETSSRDESFGERVQDFMHRHINTLKICAEVLGGYFVVRDGLARTPKNMERALRITGGAVVMAGWTGALLVKEKKPDREELKDASFFKRAVAYIQEKPLRLAGGAGLIFNALTANEALHKRNLPEGKWNLGAVGAMVGANGLYAISHKSPGGDIKTQEMVSDVYSVAAQILNKQPEAVREQAIDSTAKFLGERPEIKDTHQEIILRLKKEMDIQRSNPWFEVIGLPDYSMESKPRHHPNGLEALRKEEPATTITLAQLDRESQLARGAENTL